MNFNRKLNMHIVAIGLVIASSFLMILTILLFPISGEPSFKERVVKATFMCLPFWWGDYSSAEKLFMNVVVINYFYSVIAVFLNSLIFLKRKDFLIILCLILNIIMFPFMRFNLLTLFFNLL